MKNNMPKDVISGFNNGTYSLLNVILQLREYKPFEIRFFDKLPTNVSLQMKWVRLY